MKTIKMTHEEAMDIALIKYVGMTCSICKVAWTSIDQLKEAELVCCEKNEDGLKFACKKCFEMERQELFASKGLFEMEQTL